MTEVAAPSRLGALVDFAQRAPEKYLAIVLVLPLLLFVLMDETARRCLRTPGPYLAAAAFLVLIAPHLYWLTEQSFLPLRYADARAKVATHWYHFVTFPLQWTVSQLAFLAPTIGLLAFTLWGGRPAQQASGQDASANTAT